MKILAFSGWKGSGKDEAANFLVEKHNFIRVGFADILKDMVSEAYSIPRNYFENRELKDKYLLNYPVNSKDNFSEIIVEFLKKEFGEYKGKLYWTPRTLCILEGSIKRSVNSQYWTKKVIDYINAKINLDCNVIKLSNEHNFVISDLRYISEAEDLRKAFNVNLKLIRINRFDTIESIDPSERNLDNYKFDNIIKNKESLEEFLNKIENLIK